VSVNVRWGDGGGTLLLWCEEEGEEVRMGWRGTSVRGGRGKLKGVVVRTTHGMLTADLTISGNHSHGSESTFLLIYDSYA
jgi:hypothetical protein